MVTMDILHISDLQQEIIFAKSYLYFPRHERFISSRKEVLNFNRKDDAILSGRYRIFSTGTNTSLYINFVHIAVCKFFN